jgi:hypothetical protein
MTAAPESVAASPKLISEAPSQSVHAPVRGLWASASSPRRAAESGGTGVAAVASGAGVARPDASLTGLPNPVPLPAAEGEAPGQDISRPLQLPKPGQLSAAAGVSSTHATADAAQLPTNSESHPDRTLAVGVPPSPLLEICRERGPAADAAVGGTARLKASADVPASLSSHLPKPRPAAG